MVDIHTIETTGDVFSLYMKQKSEFHFTTKTDNDFMIFLLDTAVRVISIVQHLSPVIEAVSDANDLSYSESSANHQPDMDFTSVRDDSALPNSKRPCLREPLGMFSSASGAGLDHNTVPTVAHAAAISPQLLDQQISHHSSEFQQLEKELETLTQSLCEESAKNKAFNQALTHNLCEESAKNHAENQTQEKEGEGESDKQEFVPPDTAPAAAAPGKEVSSAESNDVEKSVQGMQTTQGVKVKTEQVEEAAQVKQEPAEDQDQQLLSFNNIPMDADTARLADAVLQSVNIHSVSSVSNMLSQLSNFPGSSTQLPPTLPPPLSGAKTFECSFCDFYTIDKVEHIKHIREHTGGEKPYTCQICDYKTMQRGNLVIHMRTHTQGRLYHCKLCSFRTSRRMYLHEHMESHAVEEKPYVCMLCDYRTSRKANLGIHMGSQKHIASVMKAKSMSISQSPGPSQENKT